jgi:hypothetical protein
MFNILSSSLVIVVQAVARDRFCSKDLHKNVHGTVLVGVASQALRCTVQD